LDVVDLATPPSGHQKRRHYRKRAEQLLAELATHPDWIASFRSAKLKQAFGLP
jgi:hypothetical protein